MRRKAFAQGHLMLVVVLVLVVSLPGCQTVNGVLNDPAVRACGGQTAFGVLAGGIAGRTLGDYAGSKTAGTIIGAAAGGAVGYSTCMQAWRHAQRLEQKYKELHARMIALEQEQKEPQDTQPRYQRTDLTTPPAAAPTIEVVENTAVHFDLPVLFEVGSSELAPRSLSYLDVLAESLQEYPESRLSIIGHTDSSGDPRANLILSQRRADAVAAYLASQGFPTDYMQAIGKGEEEPVTSNATPAGREKNRRVEFVIIPEDAVS